MALKFRRGTTAQQSGSLAFGEPFVNTTLGTLLVGGPDGDIVLSAGGTGSTGNFGPISGSGLDITGNANIAGNLTLGGTITIGDAATDNLVVNADLSSSIIPDITNVFDLGSTTKIYRNVYATSISGAIAATNGVVSGSSQITAGSTTNFATDVKTQLNSNTVVSSSVQIDLTATSNYIGGILTRLQAVGVVSGSSQVIGILSSLNSFSSSQLTQNTTLATYTGSVNTRLTEIGVVSGSLITSASAAKTTNDSQGVSITNLNSATDSLLIETSYLETFSGSVLTRLTEIGVVSGSLITSASAAKTTNDSQGVSITNLNSATASLLIETANLESFTSSINTTIKTRLDANTVVSGSSQITLSSTTGYGTVINQNVLTTSNVQHASLGIGMAASGTAGRIDATNDVVAFSSSDIRFKENIKPIENAIDKIRKISGNTYDWKEENKVEHGYEGNDVGVIAQEIEAVLPQLVQTRESGFKAVKYDKLVALLIEGIKEQQLQIEQLRIDLNNCRNNKGL